MRRWGITFAPLLLLTLRCSAFGEAGEGAGDAGAPDATVDASPDRAPTCDAAAPECADLVCQGGVCALAASCKVLHEVRPELRDGVHYLDFDGEGSNGPEPV